MVTCYTQIFKCVLDKFIFFNKSKSILKFEMVLEFYCDLLSQPCRAVYLFLKANGIEFEIKEMKIVKGDHYKPEFEKKNPFRKLPIIDDDGFVLSESVTIMKYIGRKYKVADHWFPSNNPQQQARVDEFLNWQYMFIRKPCLDITYNMFLDRLGIGVFPKQPADQAIVGKAKEEINNAVKHLDEYFLQDKPFIAGEEVSVADLMGMAEFYQLLEIDQAELYNGNTKVAAWMKRVEDKLAPHSAVANVKVKEMRDKYIEAKE